MRDNSINFCVSFLWWFREELPHTKWLKKEYVNYNERLNKWELKVDFADLYPKCMNMPYPQVFAEQPHSFFATGTLIMFAHKVLLNKKNRGAFVNEVNRRLKLYGADVRFCGNGKFREVTAESRCYDEAEEYEFSGDAYVFISICSFIVVAILLLKLL